MLKEIEEEDEQERKVGRKKEKNRATFQLKYQKHLTLNLCARLSASLATITLNTGILVYFTEEKLKL